MFIRKKGHIVTFEEINELSKKICCVVFYKQDNLKFNYFLFPRKREKTIIIDSVEIPYDLSINCDWVYILPIWKIFCFLGGSIITLNNLLALYRQF